MLSGGADGGIAMWDLEAADESRRRGTGVVARHTPMGSVARYVDATYDLSLIIVSRTPSPLTQLHCTTEQIAPTNSA